jgi:DNA-binding response OmpR family regulator
VDDDEGTRETADRVLTLEGYVVATASTGEEALAILRSVPIDLMIIDLRLPDMLGTEMVEVLRSTVAGPKFILVSAFLTTAATVQAMRLGAIDVIDKPIDIDELVAIVRRESSRDSTLADSEKPMKMISQPRSAADVGRYRSFERPRPRGISRRSKMWPRFSASAARRFARPAGWLTSNLLTPAI